MTAPGGEAAVTMTKKEVPMVIHDEWDSIVKQTLIGYIIVVALAFLLFLVLPIPFTKQTDFCPQSACKGYEFQITTQHGWYWLGGYHTTVEGLLPMDFKELMAYMEKYNNIPAALITGLGLVSLVFAGGLYALGRIAFVRRFYTKDGMGFRN